ncbi:Ankyrin repeat domain-containing protein 13C-A [Merluccius polli]|uniref:Ankyrin repeat domain-containing protein 13C-A n=1 Tax=Merluccius polli TaxID=89951 RepID=A0AA47MJC4_MERPO|nr:Ankyrin repeat domain-containing protein 13C-A [Merluccius polli]
MTGEKIRTLRKDHHKSNKNDDIMDTYDDSSNGTVHHVKTNKAFQQSVKPPSQQQLSNINANNLNANTSIGDGIVDDNKNPVLPDGLDFPVHECVFRADVRRLSSLIRVHSISQKDVHGNTPLHLAVMMGHKECALLLLAHNAPVKIKNAQGWSPLAEAISYGDRQMKREVECPFELYLSGSPLLSHSHSAEVKAAVQRECRGQEAKTTECSAGDRDLQLSLDGFAAECEAVGMRISTSKSESMVLNRKRVECTLRVGDEILPQVEEFKYLGVLFTSEGRMEREIDRRIGAASAVMRTLHGSVVVKRELSRKAKLSIYQSIYVPALTYGHELWVVTERTRSRVQAAEMSFLRRVAGLSLRDRVRSSVIREELGVDPLLLRVERSQMRWLGHLVRMPPGRLPGEVFRARPTGRRPRGRPRTRWRDYLGDFYLELHWDFQSWVPLLSRILPSDACKIYKQGNNIRLDTTLIDFTDMKCQRGDLSFIFTGDAAPAQSFVVLDNEAKVYQRIHHEESEMETEEEVDILMSSDVYSATLSTKSITFSRSQIGWLFREDKTEKVGNFLADFYAVNGLVLESRKRREHLSEEDILRNKAIMESLSKGGNISEQSFEPVRRQSLTAPPSNTISWEEYITAEHGKPPHLGRELVCKESKKNFKATVAMSQDFPLGIESLLNVLEVIAPFKHFNKLREFVQMKLPPGFPVKLDIPVFPTITATVTFQEFRYSEFEDSIFSIPAEYKEDPSRFPDL